uniref:PRAME family member 8-like isoform X2 n=1 Tax=Arvicanthis niloticus TaxID=61156 RepID=UPI001485DA84|nr:PRAME family member 8-like isoform X2 [Arvicanthis niloticus]
MSVQTPPTLLKLARQALLRDEALAMSSVEELPRELFPALFKEALDGRKTMLIKTMVAAWPFPCLPVGALMVTPDLETLKAVLDGVDMRLTREFHPRQKLQILDLRNVNHAFWNTWAGEEECDYLTETVDEKQVVTILPRHALKDCLSVVVDFYIHYCLKDEEACLLQWAQQRKAYINFCCVKMKIWALPFYVIQGILEVFHPKHIQEFKLNIGWIEDTVSRFTPCFGQMTNLHTLSLAPTYNKTFKHGWTTSPREQKYVNKFISQFSNLKGLQHLSMKGLGFLRDHMKQLFGCLRKPLETLSITHYQISQSDLDSFSCSQRLFQLKHLDMRGIILLLLDIMPLKVLLENLADTLQSLDLKGCRMSNSQLTVLIPALSHCSKLTKVNFYNNNFSMPILKDFLRHTANLNKLNVEQYPAPLECYDDLGALSTELFVQLCAELMDTLLAVRQPKNISFASEVCVRCRERCVYALGPRLCLCWQ